MGRRWGGGGKVREERQEMGRRCGGGDKVREERQDGKEMGWGGVERQWRRDEEGAERR